MPQSPPSSKQNVSSQHRQDDCCQNAGLVTRASIFARRKAPLSHGVTSKRSLLCDHTRLLVSPPGMAAELSAPAPHQQLWASLSLLLLPSLVFRKHRGWGCYTRYPRKKLLVHPRAKETLCGYREPPGQPSPAAPEQLQAEADHPPAKSPQHSYPQFPQAPAFCGRSHHKSSFVPISQLLSSKLSALPLRNRFKSPGNGNHINSRGGTGRTALCSF